MGCYYGVRIIIKKYYLKKLLIKNITLKILLLKKSLNYSCDWYISNSFATRMVTDSIKGSWQIHKCSVYDTLVWYDKYKEIV